MYTYKRNLRKVLELKYTKAAVRGVPRGDAQDARASPPLPSLKGWMRKDEEVGKKKNNQNIIKIYQMSFSSVSILFLVPI